MTNNDLQNTPHKTKDRATRTPPQTGDERERLFNFPLETQIDVKKTVLVLLFYISVTMSSCTFVENCGIHFIVCGLIC